MKKPEGSAIRAWVASGKRPVRGKGGKGRIGDIGRFLKREANEIVRGREEEGLTWDDVALAAAQVGVVRPDGSPFPGASFSTKWGQLVRKGWIKPQTTLAPPNQANTSGHLHYVPSDRLRESSLDQRGQAGGRDVGGSTLPTSTTTSPPQTTPWDSTQSEPRRTASSMGRVRRPGDGG